jgi:hypothetical protein
MSVKIYSEGNYLFIESPSGSTPLSDSKGDVDVWLNPEGKYEVDSPLIGNKVFDLSDLTDKDGTPYDLTTWNAFYRFNTGFNPAPGGSGADLDNRIVVTQSNHLTTIGGVIDSTKEYFLDGIIDMGNASITIPVGGINIKGYTFDLSGLMSTEDNYTMFISESEAIGSGNVLGSDYLINVSGLNSKVYNIYDATGFNAFEFQTINYNNCTSLGDIHNYRQGLEGGTGRFGGSPSLTLHGTWLGGFRITTSIVRGMSDITTEPMFKSGTAFVMNSRFLTDINVDLGALQPLLDFSPTNFPNPSTLQLNGCIVSREGVINSSDANLTPNINETNLVCSWKNNNGLNNTFVGGTQTVSFEVLTNLTLNVPSLLNATFNTNGLQHFDSPSNGKLRHLGGNPREYTVNFDFVLEGGSNDDYKIQLVKNNGIDNVVYQQTRVINNFSGGRDVAYFTGLTSVILDKNDYIFWEVINISDNSNCTLELDSAFSVQER